MTKVAFLSVLLLVPATASAHALLTSPMPRDQSDAHKDPTGPCGVTRLDAQPSTTLIPGQSITVTWNETVIHPGCFLVDFSAGGDADFQTPVVVPHMNDGPLPRPYSASFTLPRAPCEACTLRVRQLMLNDEDIPCPPLDGVIPPNVTYFTCANVRLMNPASDGCSCAVPAAGGRGTGAALAGVFALVLVAVARRRRR